MRQTKPHPQPLPEEGGDQLAFEMEEVILGVISDGVIADNTKQNELMQKAG